MCFDILYNLWLSHISPKKNWAR